MQLDFHYYASYTAAIIAGYSHDESLAIAYSAQFTDECSVTYLKSINAPVSAATTQTQAELANARTDLLGLQEITRIWSSFHFLPRNLDVNPRVRCTRKYRRKYRLICGPNGDLLVDTVKNAKGKSLQAAGIAMHVLADTWAHQYFAGTPSLVINNVSGTVNEIKYVDGEAVEIPIKFRHNPAASDDIENSVYTNSIYQTGESSVMNLGHGRAGHLPDYSFVRYKYMPSWAEYREVIKDNPMDYAQAFTQMIYAMKYLRGIYTDFEREKYDVEAIMPWKDEILRIITKPQLDASEDWKALGEKLSGHIIEDFDANKYRDEYINSPDENKDDTFLGRYILGALSQKSLVTNRIYSSGNLLAGYSINYNDKGFAGIKDYARLLKEEAASDD